MAKSSRRWGPGKLGHSRDRSITDRTTTIRGERVIRIAVSFFSKIDIIFNQMAMRTHPKNYLKGRDKTLGKVIDKVKLGKMRRNRSHFQTLVEAIISQQLSVKAADTIAKRFVALFPKNKFPTPEQVLKIQPKRIRQCGISYQKVSYIKDLAKNFAGKKHQFKNVHELADEEVILRLTEVKGIGRWTAEMFLIFSLERPDVFSYGDLGLRKAMQKLYGLRKHPSPRKAKEISDKWIPHRSLASRYLWKSIDNN